LDTNISRISAGVLGIGTGAQGSVAGTLLAGTIGIGTTSPYARLSAHAYANATYAGTLFAVASSTPTATTTHFTILANGNVGVGTSSPYAKFSIQAEGGDVDLLSVASTTAGSILRLATSSKLYLQNLSDLNYYDDRVQLQVVRGGSPVTSGYGVVPLAVFTSNYNGNSIAAVAITGRTVGAGQSVLYMGHLDDPDEGAITYDYAADSLALTLGGATAFTFTGGSDVKFGWGSPRRTSSTWGRRGRVTISGSPCGLEPTAPGTSSWSGTSRRAGRTLWGPSGFRT
jgi:hypothetical protein